MTRSTKTMFFAAAVFAVFAFTSANAASVSLDTLLAGGTFTSGDKTISDVSYTAVGNMPAASNIIVTSVEDGGNYGFRFNGGFFDLGGDNTASDAFIEFTVTVNDPSMEIVGAILQGNPAVVGTGNGIAQITETFLPTVTNAQLEIHDLHPGGFVGLDSLTFANGHKTLTVQKDILLNAEDNAVATLSFFDQYFVQQQVPEPASAGLMSFGLLGLLAAKRRRRRS